MNGAMIRKSDMTWQKSGNDPPTMGSKNEGFIEGIWMFRLESVEQPSNDSAANGLQVAHNQTPRGVNHHPAGKEAVAWPEYH